ncbi:hypothetical protein R5P06_07545 [Candidatus Thioglobus autotrophicus]|uniref:hypothetical protein n=1 Tax=Candidatus Thioglobus autotrophicus TaxID=1705394 RepID=UPI00299EC850|nr:hypothetical protein [Candidatus Thioglobus autotrophicus]WPE16393.1 hypothetical protein R5P06_07545 [Candidatus Thioglobus autotrophicus]
MKQFLTYNLIAFVAVLISRLIIVPFDHVDISIGNYIWLPMGAAILAPLLFGFKSLPGVVVGYFLATFISKGGVWEAIHIYSYLGKLIDSVAPIASILMMRFFHLSDFFDSGKINYAHVMFLVILASLVATVAKVFVYPMNGKIIPDPSLFIQTYLMSDILGGVVFIYLIFKFFTPQLIKNKLI